MNITRVCISISLAFITSTAAISTAQAAGRGRRISAVSRAALELNLASQIAAAAPLNPEANTARIALEKYSDNLQQVRHAVRSTPSEIARARLTEAESQFALARLQAYTGTWMACAEAAREALAHLESADDLAQGWRTQKVHFDIVMEDVDGTLARARRLVVVSGFNPNASSTYLHAEHARSEAAQIAAEGRLQSARWKAASARDLAIIAMEQATGHAMARPSRRPAWIASLPYRGVNGSGGDVR